MTFATVTVRSSLWCNKVFNFLISAAAQSICVSLRLSLSLWRPQNREVIVQIQKDSSQNMPANGSRKRKHNGPKWPGWESFIATDGALQKKRGNDTTELMKKVNPFHKWILDVWGSLLFKNQIKLKTAKLIFKCFFFSAFYTHKNKQ